MPGYTDEQYRAELAAAPVDEIVARLNGDYGTATYKPTPLNLEAARRLEELTALVKIEETSFHVLANMDEITKIAFKNGELVAEEACPGHVASRLDPKICGRCGVHIDSLRPED